VVKILGLGKDPNDDFVYVILERCNLGSGWDWVQKTFSKRADFPKAVVLALSVLAEGCSLMAHGGILHRDLTLDNILVDDQSQTLLFKLCDFGVSGTAADFNKVPRGKMRNYSPEAIGEGCDKYTYSERSDVYMFGLVIWEMLHNRYVWSDFNTMEANKRVLSGQIPIVDEAVIATTPAAILELMG
jgi:serine/threonine protein kinase